MKRLNYDIVLQQLPLQPLWNTDGPPVYDKRRGGSATAAALHRHGHASTWERLLGEEILHYLPSMHTYLTGLHVKNNKKKNAN